MNGGMAPRRAQGASGRSGRIVEVAARVAGLADLPLDALIVEWKRMYRASPPKRVSRSLLELGVAWKIQEVALGGISKSTKRHLVEVAGWTATDGPPPASRSTTLKPGARLVREWRGETHDVLVVDGGFEWRGKTWQSLSQIARAITGTRWSGPRFFGLEKPRTKPKPNTVEMAHD
jgi:hypothetical protein